jgi:trigger factor
MKITLKKLPKSEAQIDIIVPAEEFEAYHERGFKRVQETVEVDGFRKGNAPEDVIVKKYGDMIILEEMANLALRDAYVKAIDEHKVTPVTDPKITITKLAKGNPLELTISVPLMPEVELPSYKKLAKEATKDEEKIEVTDKDIENVLEELRKGRATQHAHEHEEHDHSDPNHTHPTPPEGSAGQAEHNNPETVLPELNDEFAQSFGPDFKTLADLKAKVGENLKLEKEQKAREKRRTAIIEKLIAETKIDMPDAIVEGELSSMMAQMRADITRFGGTWEDYLAHSKKTEEDIKADWKKDAEKRAASQLILHKIAEAEKLQATEEEIEVELVRLLAQVQDADESRARNYLYQALTNEKVLKFLEESK